MTTFYLIRHASNDLFTHTLVGRMPGVRLNDLGHHEAERVATALAREQIDQIVSSPLERCRETSQPIEKKLGLKLRISDALTEVDFGEWTGRKFAELDLRPDWKQWNSFRSGACAPGGESMLQVQVRMATLVHELRREFPERRIALVSHADPLRALILHFLGASLDFIRRIELSPASVSILAIDDWGVQVRCLNARFGESWSGS